TRVRVAALAGAALLALSACGQGGGSGDGDGLVIGTLLPQTGSLAFLGPPEIAGVDLAIKEINEAGGVLGKDVKVEHGDSSDADNAQVAQQSVTQLKSKGVHAIIGAASSAVTRNVVDDITNRSEEHTSELQSRENLVCRLLLEKKNKNSLTLD